MYDKRSFVEGAILRPPQRIVVSSTHHAPILPPTQPNNTSTPLTLPPRANEAQQLALSPAIGNLLSLNTSPSNGSSQAPTPLNPATVKNGHQSTIPQQDAALPDQQQTLQQQQRSLEEQIIKLQELQQEQLAHQISLLKLQQQQQQQQQKQVAATPVEQKPPSFSIPQRVPATPEPVATQPSPDLPAFRPAQPTVSSSPSSEAAFPYYQQPQVRYFIVIVSTSGLSNCQETV